MDPDLRGEIDAQRRRIGSLRPLRPEHVAALKTFYRVGLTYSSNAIEGNSLTESETKIVIEDGLTIGGKPLRDHYEATGHAEAYDRMLGLARGKTVTESDIRDLHRLFYRRIDEENAGRWRRARVFIGGSRHVPPPPADVPARMRAFCRAIPARRRRLHPVEFAAWLHWEFVSIHPFVDGNGRTSRLLMNLALLQAGFPVVIIPPILRAEYFAALERGRTSPDRPDSFYDFIAERAVEAMREWLRLMTP